MKTNLQIAWNNTDWSVSNFKSAFKSKEQRSVETKSNKMNSTEKRTTSGAVESVARPLNSLRREGGTPSMSLDTLLARARREAEALAWQTGFPGLFLTCLTEEKEVAARHYWLQQQSVHARSEGIVVEFAGSPLRIAA